MAKQVDTELLSAALAGYKQKLTEIESRMEEIRRRLGGKATAASGGSAATPTRASRLSPEARERIAAAQRRRWALARKAQAKKPMVKTAGGGD